MNVAIVRQQPGDLRRDYLALVAAFAAIFAIDTADAARFVASLYRHGGYPDFRCFAARDSDRGGALVGLAYGYTSRSGQWFHDRVAPALGPEAAACWLADAFEFVEFGVVPIARQFGIGARLYEAAFAGLPHRTAILSTQRDNDTAVGFYQRRGWRQIGDFPGGQEPYIVMGLDRSDDI